MSALAVGFPMPPHMVLWRDGLHVCRVHAAAIAAQMIDFQTFGNSTVC